jgi:hypothetical protein
MTSRAPMAMTAAAMAMLSSGKSGWSAQTILPPGYHVTACLQPAAHNLATVRAQYLASQIFAGIGLTLDWVKDRRSCLKDRAIRITVQSSTPATELPAALAFALPYEGSQITLFYDRIQKAVDSSDAPSLLAHVVVHEITHALQGLKHHSETGMMKAHWSAADLSRMARISLPFEEADVWLIRSGLESPRCSESFVYLLKP